MGKKGKSNRITLDPHRAVQSSRDFLSDGSLQLYLHLHACSQLFLHAAHSVIEASDVYLQVLDGLYNLPNKSLSAITQIMYYFERY
jgi:hypothetical protein